LPALRHYTQISPTVFHGTSFRADEDLKRPHKLDQRVKGKSMRYLRLLRIFSVPFALTVCASYLQAQNTLNPASTTINLSCTMGSPCIANGGSIIYSVTDVLTNTGAQALYRIAAPSVPWLTITPTTGTLAIGSSVATTQTLTGVGGNTTFTVNIQVQAAAPTLVVEGGTNVLNPVPYLTGAAAPTLSLTLASSSGTPVAFSVAVASAATPGGVSSGWLSINAGSATGIAYSWGTTIYFTASAAAINGSNPGDYDTGTITITPAGQTAISVPLNIAVSAGAPTLTTVSPALVPLLVSPVAPGFVNLVLHGTGFVSTIGAQKTKVFIGATLLTATQVSASYVTVLSPTYIQVAVPYTGAGLPFATAGTSALVVGVANGASPTAPSVTLPLGVTSAPIISSMTSASSYVEASAGTAPNAAPYDIISIFGANLCPLCTGTSNVLVGAPDPIYSRYPVYLSPDGSHKITVIFTKPTTTTTLPGYLLFATNTQINVLVPGALQTLVGTASPNTGLVNVQVAFDTATPPAAANTSLASQITYVAYDPGIFTIASSGQGQGAIVDGTTFVLNSQANYATSGTSVVSIFMTGLGVPDASNSNTNANTSGWSTSCVSPLGVAGTSSTAPTGYMGTVNTPYFSSVTATGFQQPAGSGYAVPSPLWSSIDGAVISPALLALNAVSPFTPNLPPCLSSTDASATNTLSVTFYGNTTTVGTISYAGFVSGSIAGLYQINVSVPALTGNGTAAAAYPVVVGFGTASPPVPSSQAGVTMWIK
jgi:uncharacterized protein (TIGR03437 family)